MKQYIQGLYATEGRTTNITLNAVMFYIEQDATLEDIRIVLRSAVLEGRGDAKFQVNVNGNPVFDVVPSDDRPVIAVGDRVVEITGLSIAVFKDDIVTLDKVNNGNSPSPWACIIGLEDGISVGGGAGFYTPDAPYLAPSAFDDEFVDSVLDAKWLAMSGSTPSMLTPQTAGHLLAIAPDIGSYPTLTGIYQVTTDVDQTFRMKFSIPRGLSSSHFCGIIFGDTGGANTWVGLYYDSNDNKLKAVEWSNTTSPTAASDFGVIWQNETDKESFYMQAQYVSSSKSVYMSWSKDGVNFYALGSRTTKGGGGANKVGIFCYGGEPKPVLIDWFRKLQGGYTGSF